MFVRGIMGGDRWTDRLTDKRDKLIIYIIDLTKRKLKIKLSDI